MLKRAHLMMFAVVLIQATTIDAAARGSGERAATVGEFVTRLAVAMGQDGRNPHSASDALERLGVLPPIDFEAPLTDGLVARIAADLGVGVLAPAAPQATVSSAQAASIANLIGANFVGERTGVAVEPPTECLQSANRGQCVECCKEAVGQVPNEQGNLRDAGKECSKFCRTNVPPPPSDSEPQP